MTASRARTAWLAPLARLAVAAAIVGVLAATGRLSLAPLALALERPAVWAALLALQVVLLLLGVLRWWLLLSAIDGRRHSYARLLAFTWMGQFFGCVAPSAVATDVTRFGYLRASGGATSAAAATSLLVDRACGIAGSCLLALVLAGGLLRRVVAGPRLVVALGCLAAIGLALALLHRPLQRTGVGRRLGGSVLAVRDAVSRARRASAVALAISVLAHALKALSLWLVVHGAMRADLGALATFRIGAAGFLVEALPLAPGGLGTAHLAFDRLLALHGVAGGAGAFNVYFVARLAVSLLGGIVWLAPRRAAGTVAPLPLDSAPRA
jgi:uncharacterized membrane protein YbhN (UPF0104 family)